jgi:hypothetical protein
MTTQTILTLKYLVERLDKIWQVVLNTLPRAIGKKKRELLKVASAFQIVIAFLIDMGLDATKVGEANVQLGESDKPSNRGSGQGTRKRATN